MAQKVPAPLGKRAGCPYSQRHGPVVCIGGGAFSGMRWVEPMRDHEKNIRLELGAGARRYLALLRLLHCSEGD
jgi:hypothetical protein